MNYLFQRVIIKFDRVQYMVEVNAKSTERELKLQLGVLMDTDREKIDNYLNNMHLQVIRDYNDITRIMTNSPKMGKTARYVPSCKLPAATETYLSFQGII